MDPKRKKKIPSNILHENLQVVGNTGSGKTHHVLKPLMYQTIQQKLGLFVLDVKSNMVRDIVFYADKCSRRNHFNYLDLGRPDLSMSCNPLAGGSAHEIASRVFTALYYDTTNVEPHYVQIADGFLQDLIFLMKKEIPVITFQDLATAVGETDTFRTIAALCAKYSETQQAKNFQPWFRKSPQQRQDELAGLILKLRRFCNREWSPLINSKNPNFTMKSVIDRNEIFLLGLASAKYPDDAKPLAILFMMALQSEVGERYMNPPEKPFRVVLDEFYNLSYPGFIDLVNKCRDARVNLVLAHQSNGDLSGVSQEFKEQVINNTNNKVILRLSDPATAEYFSSLIGTEVFRKQGSTSYDAGGTERGHSDRDARKFRIHPDEIKDLPVGQAIVRLCHKEKVECFKTALGTAPQPPADFELGLTHTPLRGRENHTSLEGILKDEPPKGRKKGLDLGLKFGEGDNA
ncbi:MAG TPA: TraM recognition domain-containing protein [bacterium]|nr:TraM recognition domain-containing protein [bacterium]